MKAVLSHEIGKQILDALGLPPNVRKLTLILEAGQPVLVECVHFASMLDATTVCDAVKRYRLVDDSPRELLEGGG